MTKEIQLTKGQIAVVDDEDYAIVCRHKWRAMWVKTRYYAVAYNYIGKGKYQSSCLLHRLIMGAKKGEQIDHVNGNTLDCRRCNLRFCTDSENQRNRNRHCDNASGYKGVDWMKSRQKWRARIMVDRKHIHLGLFSDPVAAARAYDRAAIQYHRDFARLNFTLKSPDEESHT